MTEFSQLLKAARAKDRKALAVLIERFSPGLVSRVRTMLRAYPQLKAQFAPEDIAQSAFLDVLRKPYRLDDQTEGRFEGVLRRAARHTLIAESRKRRGTVKGTELAMGKADSTAGPRTRVANQESLAMKRARIAKGLVRLTPAQRKIIDMQLRDLSLSEIAKSLGIGEGAARMRLTRANAALKRNLPK